MAKIIFVAAFLLAGLTGWRFTIEWKHVTAQKPNSWIEDHKADCAVVLTGSPGRVREGFDLLAQNNVKKLIISGVFPHSKLRQIFPQWPYYGPLNETNVILEKRSGTTYGNAQQTLPLVEALHCRDLILVTSALHMYRAKRIFESVFPPDFPIYPRALVRADYRETKSSIFVEASKSLFYSLWAY